MLPARRQRLRNGRIVRLKCLVPIQRLLVVLALFLSPAPSLAGDLLRRGEAGLL